MKLAGLRLNGFMGVRRADRAQEILAKHGHRNLFIGPNSSGKSTPLRFLKLVREAMRNLQPSLERMIESADPYWWWQAERTTPFSGEFQIEFDEDELPDVLKGDPGRRLVRDGAITVQVTVAPRGQSAAHIFIAPVNVAREEPQVITWVDEAGAAGRYLNQSERYEGQFDPDKCPFHAAGHQALNHFFRHVYFFSPIRDVHAERKGSEATFVIDNLSGEDDGSALIRRLEEWKRRNPSEWKPYKRRLLHQFDLVCTAGGMPSVTDIDFMESEDGAPEILLSLGRARETEVPLALMGTGVAQVLVMLAGLEFRRGAPTIYFIEEPEAHLHPRLFRRFLEMLAEYENCQFFLTSHASDALDTLGSKDMTVRFSLDDELASTAEPCVEFIEQQHLLDALGVSGGAVLQANCVIWVEGPSDRLYIREWIRAHEARTSVGDPLSEGIDYCFAFYGGALLAHVGLNPDAGRSEDEDLVALLRICRNSVVVMDRDLPSGAATDDLAPRKLRLLEEATEDDDHRRAFLTTGREIENDLGSELLARAADEVLGLEVGSVESSWITGEGRYHHEIADGLADETQRSSRARKLSDKVTLARTALDLLARGDVNDRDLPEYIPALVEFVRATRA